MRNASRTIIADRPFKQAQTITSQQPNTSGNLVFIGAEGHCLPALVRLPLPSCQGSKQSGQVSQTAVLSIMNTHRMHVEPPNVSIRFSTSPCRCMVLQCCRPPLATMLRPHSCPVFTGQGSSQAAFSSGYSSTRVAT